MPVIAITNRKGGVGKSTIAGNLSVALLGRRTTVKALDADPQQSLVRWAQLGDGLLSGMVSPLNEDDPDKFRAVVDAAAAKADWVLIDCPPVVEAATRRAAAVADIMLVPCQPSVLDLTVTHDAITVIKETQNERKDGRPLIRLVPSRVAQTRLGGELQQSLAALGPVAPAISQRVVLAETPLRGLTVLETARFGRAAAEFRTLARYLKKLKLP